MLLSDLLRLKQSILKLKENQKQDPEDNTSAAVGGSSGYVGMYQLDEIQLIDSIIWQAARLIEESYDNLKKRNDC